MNVVGIILFVLLTGLVVYLVIDTIIYIVKRVKHKKQKNDDVVDNTTDK